MNYTMSALVNFLTFNFAQILAQADPGYSGDDAAAAAGGAFGGLIGLLFGIVAYVFGSYCFQKIYQRLGMENAWLAWVPIANNWIMYRAGDQSGWWIVGLFIPFVNFVALIFLIIAFVNIFQKLGKSPWMILLFIIPIVNFWLMYHLAFS